MIRARGSRRRRPHRPVPRSAAATDEGACICRAGARAYDVALLDLDGVVYVGPDAVAARVDALAAAAAGRACARRSSRTTPRARRASVADHLRALGIPCEDDDVVTSAQAAARLVADLVEPGATVLVVGGEGLGSRCASTGLRPASAPTTSPRPSCRASARSRLGAARRGRVRARDRGAVGRVEPRRDRADRRAGRAPGNGTFVGALAADLRSRAGRRGQAGAPAVRRGGRAAAVRRVRCRRRPARHRHRGRGQRGARQPARPDRRDLGDRGGARPARQRPTYVGRDLRALLEPPRVARREGEVWRCGAWVSLVEARPGARRARCPARRRRRRRPARRRRDRRADARRARRRGPTRASHRRRRAADGLPPSRGRPQLDRRRVSPATQQHQVAERRLDP